MLEFTLDSNYPIRYNKGRRSSVMATRKTLMIVTDGACSGNPGPGGYAAIILDGAAAEEFSVVGASVHTTNNRMELLAVIEGIRAAIAYAGTYPYPDLEITSDSQYVGYAVNGEWRKKKLSMAKATLPNEDLIRALHEVLAPYTVRGGPQVAFCWVRGHDGHPLNERADALAQLGMRKLMAGITPTHKSLPKRPYDDAPPASLEDEVELVRKPKLPSYKLRVLRCRV